VLRDFLAGCPTPVAAEGVLTASYWTPLDAPPQNTVDALIADLFCHPSISAVVGPAIGAEWWWQDVDETDPPKVYHKDCNIFLEHDEATKLFPDWSSVLYLTDIGGATAMFENDEVLSVWPSPGRYLLFPGFWLHCVLHPEEWLPGDRITLLINWWSREPKGLCPSPALGLPTTWRPALSAATANAPEAGPKMPWDFMGLGFRV
ncbi:unnamed protein product, partial [Symbiodinium sp. KB8]